MANLIKTKIDEHIQKKLDKHIEKHGHRHVHKVLHHINSIQHNIVHIGELILIGCIGWGSLLFANYNTSYEIYHRDSMNEANTYLAQAIKSGKPGSDSIISTRGIDSSVNNTFAAGYCTYGAARISPEFFPYSEDKTTQQRTRGGNAIDRCENAAATGFKVGSTPVQGALVVYNAGNGISSLGHVGKVMYYNNKTQYMIVRDMNWLTRGVMADHRENTSTANIKCYIYGKMGETQNIDSTNSSSDIEIDTNTSIEGDNIGNTPNKETPSEANNTTNSDTQNTSSETQTSTETVHNTASREPENINGPITSQNLTYSKKMEINTDNVSDIAKHFLEQYHIIIEKTSKDYPSIGDTIKLSIKIKDKTSNEYFNGILPFAIKIIASNNTITPSMSKIQLIQGDSLDIVFNTEKSGTVTILISLDDDNILKLPFTVVN